MKENLTIREFITKLDKLQFENPDVQVQIQAGWFDWFCKDSSLARKTKVLGSKVKQISKSPKINMDESYVFFKNNCPVNGPLYDSFSICSLTGDVLFWVTPKSGHTHQAEVYAGPNFNEPAVQGTWKDVKEYFLK